MTIAEIHKSQKKKKKKIQKLKKQKTKKVNVVFSFLYFFFMALQFSLEIYKRPIRTFHLPIFYKVFLFLSIFKYL